jgi:tetratricopeptide (TPR) repeat protein
MLYNQQGQNSEAERLLREVASAQPELYEVKYSLGLLLAELQRYDEAVDFLSQAGRGLPDRARIQYNLGLLLQQLNRGSEAEKALAKALTIEPSNRDFALALADFYFKQRRWEAARRIAKQMITLHPDDPTGLKILDLIQQREAPP